MAITISGENNNDRILASDGVLDSISGINAVGVVTATSFTGDLTGDVTGNVTGNLTGNVNNTTLLLQTGGNERLRITSGGDVGIKVTPISGVTLQVGTPNTSTGVMRGHPDYFSIDSGSSAGGGVVGTQSNPALIFGGDGNTGLYHSASDTLNFTTGGTERLRILSNGNISVGSNGAAAEKLQVNSGNIAIIGGSYKIDTHPLVSYANFTAISGGSYAARLGSTGTSTIRSTQIYGGGGHIATFDGVNKRLGINLTVPTAKLDVSAAYNETALIATGGAINYNSCFIFKFANGDTVLEGDNGRHVVPGTDAVQDLGLSTKRWRNVYTTDLQLSNENTGGNEVDGTEGNWTLQEGESDIYMINRKTGKKYKMMLQEVN